MTSKMALGGMHHDGLKAEIGRGTFGLTAPFAAAVAIGAILPIASSADTGEWMLRTGTGESVESPAIWSDSANWRDGAVPSATSDGAYLTNALSAPLYVKAESAVSISWLKGNHQLKTFVIHLNR